VIARLESGEQAPSLTTLARLSRRLGIEFHIAITPDDVQLSA
jgi:transcriptional regulator with XRE-family HTH domain